MSLILDGTNGLSDVDGTAGTPAIRGSDANTGVFFGTDIVGVSTGGSERVRVDASGNVGIGATPSAWFANSRAIQMGSGACVGGRSNDATISEMGANQFINTSGTRTYISTAVASLYEQNAGQHRFYTAPSGTVGNAISFTQAMTLDSSGNLLVGTTTAPQTGSRFAVGSFSATGASHGVSYTNGNDIYFVRSSTTTTSTNAHYQFYNPNGVVGQINTSGSSTAFVTSSDYRLKHDIAPMTGALAKVALLKPCTYKWNADDRAGEGFIAHELQVVCPDAVTGTKDAVDAEGNPVYQGIDTSFLVATLTAAIQEQQVLITSLTARVVALEGQA